MARHNGDYHNVGNTIQGYLKVKGINKKDVNRLPCI
jgi:hypothetical protein